MTDTPMFFQRWDDARVDTRHPIRVTVFDGPRRTEEHVRSQVARFRGEMLSKAYALEHQIDALISWHLFGTRFDSASSFFSEHILESGAFGFQFKVKLAMLIIREWGEAEGVDPKGAATRLTTSKARRDRVAHWPTTLRPVQLADGETVDFVPVMSKGAESYQLTVAAQGEWLADAETVEEELREISRCVFEFARDFPEE
jgi:hypothetical protein